MILTKREKSKIICNHLGKRLFSFKKYENIYISCIMDALKEIEETEENMEELK